MVKRSEKAAWAACGWKKSRRFLRWAEASGLSSRVRSTASSLRRQSHEAALSRFGTAKTASLTMLRPPQLHTTELRIDVAADAADAAASTAAAAAPAAATATAEATATTAAAAAATAAATIVAHCARRRVRRVVTVREPLWVRRDGEGGGASARDAQGDSDVRCADVRMRGGARELQRALRWP